MWFRRDLRLDDNPAWSAATSNHSLVYGLFVLEPALLGAASPLRRDQLFAHLDALDRALKALGGGLALRRGQAHRIVPGVLADSGCSALYLNADFTRFATERDSAVEEASDVEVHRFYGSTVHKPGAVLTQKGSLSQVFSPFYKKWQRTPLAPWPIDGDAAIGALPSEALPLPEGEPRHVPGEQAAWDRLTKWLNHVDDYPDTRDEPAIEGTSDLSSDLKFGTISPRRIVEVVGTETAGTEAFVRQIAWRDWWAHTLAKNPTLADAAIRPEYDRIEWRNDPDEFARWCDGTTGYPIVDAGMRQLNSTGWMHNRVRMICASFLVKDLLIDWRWGERYFRHQLIDADVAQNAGNWQWVAGTGPDAAPYFRIFNPTAQAKKFDPKGEYIRRWVPELSGLRAPQIFQPPTLDTPPLDGFDETEPQDYPAPMVDHKQARLRTLAAYKAALSSED